MLNLLRYRQPWIAAGGAMKGIAPTTVRPVPRRAGIGMNKSFNRVHPDVIG
ncbi:MAG: hypothetical protein J0H14_22555 [Alphaproteobacteria bacterium]|jgi:hypothetical protein|nr:hypothetical protein [Alphaproteobacteria bacterium]